MKKDLAIHFTFAIALFVLITLFRDWLSLGFVAFWIGGILGTLLPDVDHLIYVYILKPNEVASQKIASLISQRQIVTTWDTLASTRADRKGLLVHNASFQVLFLIFSVLIITSGSLIGMGIALGFMLHLILDEVVDFVETGNFDQWFSGFPVNLNSEQKRWLLVANVLILLALGFFF
jgi:hypothetical protein